MKNLLLLLSVFVFLHAGIIKADVYGSYVIPPIGNPNDGGTKSQIWFTSTLSTGSKWTLTGTTTKPPYNNTWGSWLLHLLDTPQGAAQTTKLEFYDATSGNGCKVNLNNTAIVTGTCDLPLGTPITFIIKSDGTGVLHVTVNYGEPGSVITGTRDVSGITTLYGMQNGSQNNINVTITNDESKPKISVDNLSFGNVPLGYSVTRYLDVTGLYLTSGINYMLSGFDADDFTVTPASPMPKEGGRLTVTLTPTFENDLYAELTFTSDAVWSDVKAALTGTGVIFPVKENENWYRIQFAADVENGLTLQCNGESTGVTRAPITTDDDGNQLWQIVGIYNEFEIINKATGLGLAISGASIVTQAAPDMFSLDCITQTDGTKIWALYNLTHSANADDIRRYLTTDGTEALTQWQLSTSGPKALVFENVNSTGIPNIDRYSNDRVVATKYYTLLGVEILKPTTAGIYIVEKTFASGRHEASKVLIQRK